MIGTGPCRATSSSQFLHYTLLFLPIGGGNKEAETSDLPTFDISSKLTELKQTRQLGSQITMKGATLYDLLTKEVEMREKRNNVLARQLEITEVEQALRSAIKGVDEEIKVCSN